MISYWVHTKKNDGNKQSIGMLIGVVKTVVLKLQIQMHACV